jgi:hypothetical protein
MGIEWIPLELEIVIGKPAISDCMTGSIPAENE